jgi:hypothetical protein
MKDYRLVVRRVRGWIKELKDMENFRTVGPRILRDAILAQRAFTFPKRITREVFLKAFLGSVDNPYRSDGSRVPVGKSNKRPFTFTKYKRFVTFLSNNKKKRRNGTMSLAEVNDYDNKYAIVAKINSRYGDAVTQLRKSIRLAHGLGDIKQVYVVESVVPRDGEGFPGVIVPGTLGDTRDAISKASGKIEVLEERVDNLRNLQSQVV